MSTNWLLLELQALRRLRRYFVTFLESKAGSAFENVLLTFKVSPTLRWLDWVVETDKTYCDINIPLKIIRGVKKLRGIKRVDTKVDEIVTKGMKQLM